MRFDTLVRSATRLAPYETLEELFTHRDGFGVTTASPLQRAVCRAVDGRPLGDLWDDPEVRKAFGGVAPTSEPDEVVIVTGIRSGKSKLAACAAVHMTQTCRMESPSGVPLAPGEVPRVSVLSVKTDLAQVVFSQHLLGSVMASPFLRELVMGDPTKDMVRLRHPSGRPVEVYITAGSRAGAGLVARWSAGVIFDEAARMQGQEDGVVNLDDQRAAVRHRLLRGTKLWYITSKWAPTGLIHEWETQELGKPGPRLVVSAPADVMNPVIWTKEAIAEAYDKDPKNARVDLGNEYADPDSGLMSEALLKRARRESPVNLEPDDELSYVAVMDPATRGNSWTLVITTKRKGRILTAFNKQWTGSKAQPLDPDVILGEIQKICALYRVPYAYTDQWASDAVKALARHRGLGIVAEDLRGPDRTDVYLSFLRRLESGMVELPPDLQVTRDLLGVRRRTGGDGSVRIVVTKTGDGRHCDYAPPLVAAASKWMEELAKPAEGEQADEQQELEDFEAMEPWRLMDGDVEVEEFYEY